MESKIKDAVLKLSDEQKIEIIKQYEQFEKDGCIGDVELRSLVEEIQVIDKGHFFPLHAMSIALECYRYFAARAYPEGNHTAIAPIWGSLAPIEEPKSAWNAQRRITP